MLKLREAKGMYPPRFNVFISCSPTIRQSKVRIEFSGSSRELVFDIPLALSPQQSTGIIAVPPSKYSHTHCAQVGDS